MVAMADPAKDHLHRYLQAGREALLWKLEGLDEYDIRRPLTPTGTNLLGLVKHTAITELGYLGPVFGREHGIEEPWTAEDAEPNADMWAGSQETRAEVVDLYHRAWEHGDATIETLDLDAPGTVPWWGKRGKVTLHRILVHLIAETHRHAGHADIVRELIDGATGMQRGNENMPDVDHDGWAAYHRRLEESARQAVAGA